MMQTNGSVWRAIVVVVGVWAIGGGGTLFTPRRAEAQIRARRPMSDPYEFNRVGFDWDLNGITVRNRYSVESRIRQELFDNPGSRYIRRRASSSGRIDVRIVMRRAKSDRIQAEVRLGLNRDGRGEPSVTATESETVYSTDRNVDGDVVLKAFRRSRREFGDKVDEFRRREN